MVEGGRRHGDGCPRWRTVGDTGPESCRGGELMLLIFILTNNNNNNNNNYYYYYYYYYYNFYTSESLQLLLI